MCSCRLERQLRAARLLCMTWSNTLFKTRCLEFLSVVQFCSVIWYMAPMIAVIMGRCKSRQSILNDVTYPGRKQTPISPPAKANERATALTWHFVDRFFSFTRHFACVKTNKAKGESTEPAKWSTVSEQSKLTIGVKAPWEINHSSQVP